MGLVTQIPGLEMSQMLADLSYLNIAALCHLSEVGVAALFHGGNPLLQVDLQKIHSQ